eukprot:gene15192-17978_t
MDRIEDFYEIGDIFYRVGGLETKIKEAIEYLSLLLRTDYGIIRGHIGAPGLGGVIVTGPHGSGKTLISTALCSYFASLPSSLAYVVKLNCSTLKDKKVEKIRKAFDMIFSKARASRPSVVLLEDLDSILGNANEQDPGSKIRCDQIGMHLRRLAMESASQDHPMVIVVTAQSTQSLNKDIQAPELFGYTLEISPPSRDDRSDIIKRCYAAHGLSLADTHLSLNKFSSSLEGFLPADLEQLVERSIHNASIKSMDDAPTDPQIIKFSALEEAKVGYTPNALKGIKLHTSDAARWSDIGGLASVRSMMKETIGWPARYPRLFGSSPIRMRSGLLLYGPPGCGKTMLASSVAGECGLHFISVKGPELLNKYIGSSEQAVRDMFARAASATPCVLFFDEFDSIAPRRGHDSTGVTDRVVNQFLTELDGVEGLRGVYVLAATSRPDLIDPALLRPGRLDKSLFCNIPEEHERLEVTKLFIFSIYQAMSNHPI